MSNDFWDKIEQIKTHERMSQNDFAQRIDVSANTLNASKTRGATPRFELIQKIIATFPQYTLWLTLNKVEPSVGQTKPTTDEETQSDFFKIIDRVDARDLRNSIVRETEFKTINFIQSNTEESNLAALIELKQSRLYQSSSTPHFKNVVWIDSGILNFDSDHGGKNALDSFRDYLSEVDFDLIEKSKLYEIEEKILGYIHKSLTLSTEDLLAPDESKKTYARFLAWKKGDAPYDN